MGWKVKLVFSDGETVEDEYNVYKTEADAYQGGVELRSEYNAGGDILNMSNPGDYPLDWEEPEIEVYEV